MDNNYITIEIDRTQKWYKNEKLHREGDKPAIIYTDGTQKWYKNGKLHREGDKPAIIKWDDSKEWWVNGEFIRKEKPLIEFKPAKDNKQIYFI